MWGKRKDKRASNVQLSPQEVEYYRKRFLAKPAYIPPDCMPMSPREAAKMEDKLGVRKKDYVPPPKLGKS